LPLVNTKLIHEGHPQKGFCCHAYLTQGSVLMLDPKDCKLEAGHSHFGNR
jgi:hypothetical protein